MLTLTLILTLNTNHQVPVCPRQKLFTLSIDPIHSYILRFFGEASAFLMMRHKTNNICLHWALGRFSTLVHATGEIYSSCPLSCSSSLVHCMSLCLLLLFVHFQPTGLGCVKKFPSSLNVLCNIRIWGVILALGNEIWTTWYLASALYGSQCFYSVITSITAAAMHMSLDTRIAKKIHRWEKWSKDSALIVT